VTIGSGATAGASLSIDATANWTIDGAVGMAQGASAPSSLVVAGNLIKSGAGGVSTIGLATTDTGVIEADAGTLDFSKALAGPGALKIDAGAVLEADSSAASTLTATFTGASATLALTAPKKFAATIAGFADGDTIDLLKIAATGASVNGKDQLVIVDGTTTVATLQLTGHYHGSKFTVVSDGDGGTDITLGGDANALPPGSPTPSAHLLVAAMAAVGGGAGEAMILHDPTAVRAPMLSRPGVQAF
jgi:hypothetical protein